MTLYEHATDFFALKQLFEEASLDADGNPKEMDDDTRKALDELAQQWKSDFQVKAERVCKFRANVVADRDECLAQAAIFQAEADRLKNVAKAHGRTISGLDYVIFRVLGFLGLRKLPAGTFTLSIMKNPPALDVLDESKVPPQFFDVVPETLVLNKAKLKEALKDGDIPGARLVQGERLGVK